MSDASKRERIGVFGGTFDPIHIGHLLIAELAKEHLELDRVLLVPAAVSPFKTGREPRADAKQRLEMVRLATGGNPAFLVDDREMQRGGTSYTIDTLTELAEENENADLYFLIGGDSVRDFPKWKEPAAICERATIGVLARGGHAPPNIGLITDLVPQKKPDEVAVLIPTRQIEISSSDLRSRFASGGSTRYQLHPAVEAYVASQGLYTN